MADLIAKTINLCRFVEGPDFQPTGPFFVSISHGIGSWGIHPESWGYYGFESEKDDVIIAHLLEQIADQAEISGEPEDRRGKALGLLQESGKKGITLKLTEEQWDKMGEKSREERLEGISLPRPERR